MVEQSFAVEAERELLALSVGWQVRHFEAHGTGTPLGDPIEVGALQAGSLDEGPRQQPVGVAAVKTNVGHLEAVACISPARLRLRQYYSSKNDVYI